MATVHARVLAETTIHAALRTLPESTPQAALPQAPTPQRVQLAQEGLCTMDLEEMPELPQLPRVPKAPAQMARRRMAPRWHWTLGAATALLSCSLAYSLASLWSCRTTSSSAVCDSICCIEWPDSGGHTSRRHTCVGLAMDLKCLVLAFSACSCICHRAEGISLYHNW